MDSAVRFERGDAMDRGGTGWRLALVLAVALAVRVVAAFVIQASLQPNEPDFP